MRKRRALGSDDSDWLLCKYCSSALVSSCSDNATSVFVL
jgi:hypothetical protein